MTRNEYLKKAFEAYNVGRINEDTYDAMVMNANIFCDEDENDYEDDRLPPWYAEIEYKDMDSPEAISGARFDDLNYIRYMER